MLGYTFYNRDPCVVAKNLLGHILKKNDMASRIVETEAYYGMGDPASRAFMGKTQMNKWMWNKAGTIFIYMVHGHWLLNIITERKNLPSGVLIRAVEPLEGINIMVKNRPVEVVRNLTSGPGKLTQAYGITKNLNGQDIFKKKSEVTIWEGPNISFDIISSHRIGVKRDVSEKLRFYIRDNPFVSKP
jgi:DNA-3-methyladenine glycosylase